MGMDTLLTPKQVAERLAVSPRTVYSWIEEGRLPVVKLSERVTRIPEVAVDALVSDASRPATAGTLAAEDRASYTPRSAGSATGLIESAANPAGRLQELLSAHRDEILATAKRRRATNVRVFGSVARGDATEESDIDILVDLLPNASLFDLGGLNGELEVLLGVSVDVVPARNLKPAIRDRVLDEAVPL